MAHWPGPLSLAPQPPHGAGTVVLGSLTRASVRRTLSPSQKKPTKGEFCDRHACPGVCRVVPTSRDWYSCNATCVHVQHPIDHNFFCASACDTGFKTPAEEYCGEPKCAKELARQAAKEAKLDRLEEKTRIAAAKQRVKTEQRAAEAAIKAKTKADKAEAKRTKAAEAEAKRVASTYVEPAEDGGSVAVGTGGQVAVKPAGADGSDDSDYEFFGFSDVESDDCISTSSNGTAGNRPVRRRVRPPIYHVLRPRLLSMLGCCCCCCCLLWSAKNLQWV